MHKVTYYFMNGDTLVFTGDLTRLNKEVETWIAAKKSGKNYIAQLFPNGCSQAWDVSMAYKAEVQAIE